MYKSTSTIFNTPHPLLLSSSFLLVPKHKWSLFYIAVTQFLGPDSAYKRKHAIFFFLSLAYFA
jgi:hypothetical protein